MDEQLDTILQETLSLRARLTAQLARAAERQDDAWITQLEHALAELDGVLELIRRTSPDA